MAECRCTVGMVHVPCGFYVHPTTEPLSFTVVGRIGSAFAKPVSQRPEIIHLKGSSFLSRSFNSRIK